MDDFKAWLRSSDFWWDESAIELGASFPSTDGAGPPAPRAGVRALRRLEAGDVLARIPRARCLTRASCAYPDAASLIERMNLLPPRIALPVLLLHDPFHPPAKKWDDVV